MKLIAAFLAFTPAWAMASVMTCSDIQLLSQDDQGRPIWTDSGLDITIDAVAWGKGFRATIAQGSKSYQEQDTDVTVSPARPGQIKDLTASVRPDIDWNGVDQTRIGNVGVAANLRDSSGSMIIELLDKNGAVLGRVVTVGWTPGKCAN